MHKKTKGAGKNASEILLMDDADKAGFGSPVEKNALMIKNKYKQHMKKKKISVLKLIAADCPSISTRLCFYHLWAVKAFLLHKHDQNH